MQFQVMNDPKGYITEEDAQKVMDSADNIKEYLIIRILSRTGIRVSELIKIQVKNILFKDSQIIIRQLKKRGEYHRNAFIDSETCEILQQYVKAKSLTQEDYLFPVTRQTIFIIVRKLGDKSGVTHIGSKRIHPHHFRHGFVMKGIKKGIDIRKLQLLVGHSSYNTTAGYLQFGSKELKEDYDKMYS